MEARQSRAGELRERFRRLGEFDEYDDERCADLVSEIDAIRRLKEQRGAVLLAHNYQRPEIFEVADFVGDSFELARKAATVSAPVIVFCGVHFMAETAKILNPHMTVLLPDTAAGCSLAESVTADSLTERAEELRALYPDLQVVTYVNTTADVKAASDICCTSSNAVRIVESLPSEHILFVPDRNLAEYVQSKTSKTIIAWDGDCYVHQQIEPGQIEAIKRNLPGIEVLVHPECRSDVIALADGVLSTSAMIQHARASSANRFLVVTECGLSDRLRIELPEKKFLKACKLCQYMKMITIEQARHSLESMEHEIKVSEDVRWRAERALRRMLEFS